MVHPRICIMMFSRISKNKTQTCPKQHAKVILEVDFQKVIRVLKKKKKVNNSMLLYMNIHL